jgi:hypothetical protein
MLHCFRAKRLLDLTELPMTEVALQAGFRSLRRFNAVVVEVYRRSPTQVRTFASANGWVHRSRDRSIRRQTACPFAEKSPCAKSRLRSRCCPRRSWQVMAPSDRRARVPIYREVTQTGFSHPPHPMPDEIVLGVVTLKGLHDLIDSAREAMVGRCEGRAAWSCR